MTTRAALTAAMLLSTAPAWAVTPFPAGAEAKTAGMGSTLVSSGPPALLYNPANLTLNATDGGASAAPYAELGVVRARYSYEHPDFDPVTVTVTSPTATLGYQQQVSRFAVGFVVFPTASGKTEIPGLPRDVGGSMTALEVVNEDEVYEVAAGASTRIGEHVTAGLAVQHTIESHHLTARVIGNEDPLVDIAYRNQFTRPVVGTRAAWRGVTGALSYRPSLVKRYRGSQTTAGRVEDGPKVVDYEPATVNAGVAGAWEKWRFGLEAAHERWRPAGNIVKDGIADDAPDADLNDVTAISVSGGYDVSPRARINAGYARLPSPWGNGHDDGVLANHLYGVDYGQLNGVDRQVFALGGGYQVGSYSVGGSVSHAAGDRLVDSNGDNHGYYDLQMTTVSGSLSAGF